MSEQHIHIHVHPDAETQRLLRHIAHKLDIEQGEITQMAATVDQVLNDVTAQTTLVDGVKTLVQGLKDQLAVQGVDQAKIDAAFAGLEANNAALALVTNVPAAPPA